MRLWLSDKAAKAMKDLPAAMKAASDGQPKPAGEAGAEAKDDKRAKEDEAREAKKEAKKELKEATAKADAELADAFAAAQGLEKQAHDLEYRVGERKKDAKHSRQAVEDAERRLEEAQKALERAKKEAARAEEQVPQLEAQLETLKGELGGKKERLQKALGEADAAWRDVHPRNRKKRDRRTRHAAIQLLGIRPPAENEGEGEGEAGAAPEAPTA
jgi:chromosome segregation ATPase